VLRLKKLEQHEKLKNGANNENKGQKRQNLELNVKKPRGNVRKRLNGKPQNAGLIRKLQKSVRKSANKLRNSGAESRSLSVS